MKHVKIECNDPECTGNCNACNLFMCSVCGAAEGTLPIHCPGRKMTEIEEHAVWNGIINFEDGVWSKTSIQPASSRIYAGKRIKFVVRSQPPVVQVKYHDGDVRDLEMSGRGHNHSPTGFEWGYGGSGPSALAHSILNHSIGSTLADIFYQDFKREFVVNWGNEWKISTEEIHNWVAARLDVLKEA